MPRAKKVSITSLRNLPQYISKINPTLVENELIGALAREGQRIINLAYASRGFENQSWNLHDSYVSAVFKGGKLVPGTVRYVGKEESKWFRDVATAEKKDTQPVSGREEANKFLNTLRFSPRPGGIALIIAAAMFYSGIVESRGYSVLANVQTDLNELATVGVKGVSYLAHIDLDYSSSPSILRTDRMIVR